MSEPRDLWALITAVPRAHKLVDFPKKNEQGEPICQVAIWVLTQNEQELAQAGALARHEKMLARTSGGDNKKPQQDDLYNNCAADELLFRACRHPDDIANKPFFPGVDAVRQLSVDEVGVLCTHYYAVQEELGPIVARMTEEETEAFIERLAVSGDRYPLDSCSPGMLRTLVLSMASLLHNYRTGKSSPGSQPENAPTNSASE